MGHRVPSRVVTNHDFEATLDTTDEWIRSRVGVRERRVLADESLLDLALGAAQDAVGMSGGLVEDVDLVVAATMTAADRCPSFAAQLAARLELARPAAFDVNGACAGFSQALAIADHAIRCGSARRALVVGADAMSSVLDWSDRTTAILMADGAGAVVLEASVEAGVGPVAWGSDPGSVHLVRIPGAEGPFQQEGPSVFRWAITHARSVARDAMDRAGVGAEDLVAFVPHQANLRIIHTLADQLGIPRERTAQEVTVLGNTSAGTIPIALSRLVSQGVVDRPGPVLLLGFGGGFAFSAQVVELPVLAA